MPNLLTPTRELPVHFCIKIWSLQKCSNSKILCHPTIISFHEVNKKEERGSSGQSSEEVKSQRGDGQEKGPCNPSSMPKRQVNVLFYEPTTCTLIQTITISGPDNKAFSKQWQNHDQLIRCKTLFSRDFFMRRYCKDQLRVQLYLQPADHPTGLGCFIRRYLFSSTYWLQFIQEIWDACQPLTPSLKVSVLQHRRHDFWIASTDGLLEH